MSVIKNVLMVICVLWLSNRLTIVPPQVHHGFATPQGPPPQQQQAAIPGYPMGMAAHPSMGPPAPAPTFDPNTPVEEREFDAICQVPVGSIVALVGGGQRYKPVSLSDLPATAPEPVRVPSLFTRFRPYLAHFPPRSPPFLARFHRLAEAVPTSPKPEPRAEKQPAPGPRVPNSALRSTGDPRFRQRVPQAAPRNVLPEARRGAGAAARRVLAVRGGSRPWGGGEAALAVEEPEAAAVTLAVEVRSRPFRSGCAGACGGAARAFSLVLVFRPVQALLSV
eukprot:COSAG04_NODE_55_length_30619_cov_12.038991_4_plen_279_part_00